MTTQIWPMLLSGVIAFGIAGVPFSWLWGWTFFRDEAGNRLDITRYRSKSSGGTNLVRVCADLKIPWYRSVWGMLLDVLKGVIAVATALLVVSPIHESERLNLAFLFVACAVLGNRLLPRTWGWKGGKGIAVAGGGLVAINWQIGLPIIGIWLLVSVLCDMISAGSIFSAIALPFYCALWFHGGLVATAFATIGGAVVVWGHRENAKRIFWREENEIKPKLHRKYILPPLRWLGEALLRPVVFESGVIILAILMLFADVRGRKEMARVHGRTLIVANHVKWCDPMVVAVLTWRRVVYIAKVEFWSNVFGAAFMWLTETVPVDRHNLRSKGVAGVTLAKKIAAGRIGGIFPGGTRAKSIDESIEHLQEVGSVAAKASCDVVVAVVGYRNGKWYRPAVRAAVCCYDFEGLSGPEIDARVQRQFAALRAQLPADATA